MTLLVFAIAAQAVIAQPASLDVFKPFVGACWRADFSATVNDIHCFEEMYGGAHIRDRHEVRDGGKTVYAGETIYSADGSGSVFTYFNSLGGVGTGTVSGADKRLGFKGTMRASPDKPAQAIDSEWRIVDADHYEVRSLVKSSSSGGVPVLKFARVKEPAER